MNDKALIAALVTVAAAVAASFGIPVSTDEQGVVVQGVASIVGSVAAIVAIVRAKAAIVSSRARSARAPRSRGEGSQ